MEVKFFEIRDRAALIPAMAVRVQMDDISSAPAWLLSRAGYAFEDILTGSLVLLIELSNGVGAACCDPYDWPCDTKAPAHKHITQNWDKLADGQVIDSEYLRGERVAPRTSERLTTAEGA